MKAWLTEQPDGIRLTLHVQPGARKSEVAGEHGEALKIRLAAPPVEGKANAALLLWLAGCLQVPRKAVSLLSGERNRHKIVAVTGIGAVEALARLLPASSQA
ncbi:DUF167 family protein [Vogesella sp. LIG4]|uniref:DUF167 domain-containing protein n=1 Tax=Vogesella sp. LIG4 TaxID=1192162 RepID=UPI00081F8F42|nr:DUF167 family protein [Vogesella sp. LIG4]SCK10422.1 hypothetical protein PSELUDRAFT_0779 [Vogesella sp. LIG4]